MIKRSVSFVVRHPTERDLVLAVRRPADDDDLPDAWGLPAASLRDGETWQEAARRAGREKLGVELEVGEVIEEGELVRGGAERGYTLRMRLYEARIVSGEPSVPQSDRDVTQYRELDWAREDRFEAAAAAGSLCCRLYLQSVARRG